MTREVTVQPMLELEPAALRERHAGQVERVNAVRAAGWSKVVVAAVYLSVAGAVVYVGAGEGLFYLAPIVLGLVLGRWWAVAVPLLVLAPLPALLVVSPPSEHDEYGAAGLAFLVAYSTAIQCALVAVGVGLARIVGSRRRQVRPSM